MTDQPSLGERLNLQPSLTVRLTDDELNLVLTLLNIPRIMGHETEPPSPEAFRAAQNTLRARGGALLTPDGELVINKEIADLVGTAARWSRLIQVSTKLTEALVDVQQIFFQQGKPVYHSKPMPRLHQFQTIPDGKTMVLVMASILRLRLRNRAEPRGRVFDLKPSYLDQIEVLRLSKGADAAYQAMVKDGVDEDFARTYTQPAFNVGVSVIWATQTEPDETGRVPFMRRRFTVMAAPDEQSYWMIQFDFTGKMLLIVPAKPTQVLDYVNDLLQEDMLATDEG